jgi:SAM-dependent methyltransferase
VRAFRYDGVIVRLVVLVLAGVGLAVLTGAALAATIGGGRGGGARGGGGGRAQATQGEALAGAGTVDRRDRFRAPAATIERLAIRSGARIADVGAGDGYLTWRLAEAAGPRGAVVATDIDPWALLALCTRARAAGAPVSPRLVGADALGLEPGRYDLIVVAEVDQLLPDRRRAFAAMAQALAPGGRIAVENRAPYREDVGAAAAAAGLEVQVLPAGAARFLVVLTPAVPPPHREVLSP